MDPAGPSVRLEARLVDCGGPRWSRLFVDGAVSAVIGLAGFRALQGTGGPLTTFLFAVGAPLPILGWWGTRHAPRDVELCVRPGAVRVVGGRGARLLRQTIRSKDVRAASSAFAGGRYLLSLEVARHEGHPVTLEVMTRPQLTSLHQALGLSASDTGVLGFPVERRVSGAAFLGFRLLLGAVLARTAWALFEGTSGALGGGLFALFLFWAGFTRGSGMRDVALTPSGLSLYQKGIRVVPWANVKGAELVKNELVLYVPERVAIPTTFTGSPGGRQRAELDVLVAHLQAAIDRGPRKAEPREVHEALFPLRRTVGEPTAAWFGRLDALSGSAGGGKGEYRGGSLDLEAMRRVLEDADADLDLRAAAARILGRLEPPARARVPLEAALATAPHERVRAAIEHASDPHAEEAAEAFDAAVGRAAPPMVQTLR